MRGWILGQMTPARAAKATAVSAEVNQAVAGYMLGNLLTSLIAGVVVFVTLMILGVPYPLLWGLWVALVDFLPDDRRGAGRHPHRAVRLHPFPYRGHRHRDRLHRLSPRSRTTS